jgi:hypothetical protein
MKFLLLVIITAWSFGGGGFGNTPKKQIVSSPEQAAILVWQNEQSKQYPDPDQYVYRLYEIDLENNTMKQVCIPLVEFNINKINIDKEEGSK